MGSKIENAELDQARHQMTTLAHNMALTFGPVAAGELLLGAALGLIENALGPQMACSYLRGLADEIEDDDDLPAPQVIGHA